MRRFSLTRSVNKSVSPVSSLSNSPSARLAFSSNHALVNPTTLASTSRFFAIAIARSYAHPFDVVGFKLNASTRPSSARLA